MRNWYLEGRKERKGKERKGKERKEGRKKGSERRKEYEGISRKG
jgi:hypothetical protein